MPDVASPLREGTLPEGVAGDTGGGCCEPAILTRCASPVSPTGDCIGLMESAERLADDTMAPSSCRRVNIA